MFQAVPVIFLLGVQVGLPAISAPAPLPVLTNVAQVHRLTPDEAKRGWPVRLQGVVTYHDPHWGHLFVQDETGGIFVSDPPKTPALTGGERVVLTGASQAGDYAPIVLHRRLEVLGPGGFPRPYQDLLHVLEPGRYDSQWVEINAVVRTAWEEDRHRILNLAVAGVRCQAYLPLRPNQAWPSNLVGSEVTIRGVCGTVFNPRRQAVSIKLFVPDLSQIQVTRPGFDDPYTAPLRAIDTLLRYAQEESYARHVKISGVVTLSFTNGAFYLQDASGGVLVQPHSVAPIQPGSQVEAVGFPAVQNFRPELLDAYCRVTGKAPLPQAIAVTPQNLLAGDYDGELVQLEGELFGIAYRAGQARLTLQSHGHPVDAVLESNARTLPAFKPGSQLRLTGICYVLMDEAQQLHAILLWLRSVNDVSLLVAPSWWTAPRALTALGAVAVVSLTTVGWVLLLRRRVREQTAEMRQRLQREQALEKHYRALVENATDVVYAHDLQGNFTAVNETGLRLMGYSREEALRLNLAQVVMPEHLERVRHFITDKLAGGTATATMYEVAVRTKDGRQVWMEVGTRLLYEKDTPVGVQGIARDITQRKEAEEALSQSEARFRAVYNAVNDAIVTHEIETGRILEGNARAEELFGYSIAELRNLSLAALGSGQPPYTQQEASQWRQKTAAGQPQRFEWLAKAKDGRLFWVEINMRRAKIGGADRILITVRDINDRKQAEVALRTSEERYRQFLQSFEGIAYQADHLTFLPIFFHGQVEAITGYPAEAFTSGRLLWNQIIHPDDLPAVHAEGMKLKTQLDYVAGMEYRVVCKNGQIRWMHDIARTITDTAGHSLIQGAIYDVTARRETQQALQKSEANLRLAQQIGHLGSWEVDVARKTLEWSAETYHIFGCDPVSFQPTRESFLTLVHPTERERVRQAAQEALASGSDYAIEHRIIRRDGAERVVFEQARILRDDRGAAVRMVGTVQDITERKHTEAARVRLEDRLRQLQKMEAIGQLAAGVAHDFNNILTVIQGNAGLLEAKFPDHLHMIEHVRQIGDAAERAAGLTRQLLLFSRKQVAQPQILNLNDLIGNLIKMLGRLIGEHIHLQCNYAPALPPIHADPIMIEQVIMNLAVNARDAMPEEGALTISTSLATVDAQQVRANPQAREGAFVCLTINDTGCGMDDATLTRIFEPFFTTKEAGKGTGLGLATVYGIVQQHQGWVEVRSQVRQGTTFSVFFPSQMEAAAAIQRGVMPTAVKGGKETILVVEDEPAVRTMVSTVLKQHGYQVVSAGSGVEALTEWAARREAIDMLLTDLVMPHGISGFELARRLRQDKPGLKVIFTSGYSAEATQPGLIQNVETRFLQKPYSIADFVLLVRDCLDGRMQHG